VVGAGPAGLSAALAAARAGAQVTLIDNYRSPGGQYYRQPAAEFKAVQPESHQREGKILWEEVTAARVELLRETTVWGAFEGNQLALYGPASPPNLQAQAIILATGAYERIAAFPGWTLPGVMTTGAVQTLLKEQRILPGRRVVLAGTGPLQLVVAAELVQAGAEVVAILEGSRLLRKALRRPLSHAPALWGQWDRLSEGLRGQLTLRRAGVPFQTGWGVVAAHGQDEVAEVTIAQLDETWRPIPDTPRTLACDTLCCSYGFVPAIELAQLLGARCEWRPERGGFVPLREEHMETSVPGVFAAGDGAGVGGGPLALIEGRIAGLAAAAQSSNGEDTTAILDDIERLKPALRRERRFQQLYAGLFTPGPGLDELAGPDTIICRCEEVTRAEIGEAVRMGADTLDAVKALTRCGMGNCQSRVCGPLVAALIARETGRPRAEVGQFRVRPPVFPIPLTALKAVTEDQAANTLEGGGIAR
jgi:NADPH-dependent 2,4-dienoyl-CoA reductase/sulfur reductase-like enzyme/bacterioferritin-associated ferredoxin